LIKSSLRRFPVAVLTAALTLSPATAQSHPVPLQLSRQPNLAKNFSLFSALERNSAAREALASDREIALVASARRSGLDYAVRSCKQDVACELRAVAWTDEEILRVSLALQRLGDTNPAVKAVVVGDLRPSMAYPVLSNLGSGEMLARAWEISAHGVNEILAVYGEGMAPRYPAIDSISFDMKSDEAKRRLAALVSADSAPDTATHPFYELSLQTALTLLTLNRRDEAGRHEPMDDGVNKPAVAAVATTTWQRYPYTVIVVPGEGPSDPQTPLSEEGRQRVALAVEAYRAGKAPFILVSGGYVHPAQTRFSEAIEMKRALMADFHIPEAAIFVDPHARHTTTNMRNAAREIFRYGIPTDKPALVVTTPGQASYIGAPSLSERCVRELGYVPYRIVRKVSATEIAFLPLVDSLEEDPDDPLDP
jgi:hypothetical protein